MASDPNVFGRIRNDPPTHFNMQQQKDRDADELVGLCRGLLSDGAVSGQEADFLRDWIERHAVHAGEYPFNVLYRQLRSALADGVLDQDEERDLLSSLSALVGGEAPGALPGSASLATALPLCCPAPTLFFQSVVFVVTGTFSYGPRRQVVEAIEARSGIVSSNVTKKVGFLIIGEVGSQAWRHSSYGRKIESAIQLRESGLPIRIVSEQHWHAALSST